jgi:hypothetical protein
VDDHRAVTTARLSDAGLTAKFVDFGEMFGGQSDGNFYKLSSPTPCFRPHVGSAFTGTVLKFQELFSDIF